MYLDLAWEPYHIRVVSQCTLTSEICIASHSPSIWVYKAACNTHIKLSLRSRADVVLLCSSIIVWVSRTRGKLFQCWCDGAFKWRSHSIKEHCTDKCSDCPIRHFSFERAHFSKRVNTGVSSHHSTCVFLDSVVSWPCFTAMITTQCVWAISTLK